MLCCLFSHVWLCNPMDCNLPGSSAGFSRPEYWSRLPFSSPGYLPKPGMEPKSLISPALAGGFFTTSINVIYFIPKQHSPIFSSFPPLPSAFISYYVCFKWFNVIICWLATTSDPFFLRYYYEIVTFPKHITNNITVLFKSISCSSLSSETCKKKKRENI